MHQRSASAYPATNSAGYLSEVRMLKISSGYNVTILIGLRNECFPIKDDDDDDRVFLCDFSYSTLQSRVGGSEIINTVYFSHSNLDPN